MKRKRVYISIPISGHDLEEVKEKARKAKYGCHIGMTQSLHSTFVPNSTSHTRTIWART